MAFSRVSEDQLTNLSDAELELLVQDGGGFVALHILENINRGVGEPLQIQLTEAVLENHDESCLTDACRNPALDVTHRFDMAILAKDGLTITELLVENWTSFDKAIREVAATDHLCINQINRVLSCAIGITMEERRELAGIVRYLESNCLDEDEEDDSVVDGPGDYYHTAMTAARDKAFALGFAVGLLCATITWSILLWSDGCFSQKPEPHHPSSSKSQLCYTGDHAVQNRNS